jgi:peptidoglycan/LPS O-acetylase OafA/YrhL
MNDDRDLADLLGEAPTTPDPAHSILVLMRIAERARQRKALVRGAWTFGAFSAVGLMVPLVQTVGLPAADVQAILLVAGVLGLAYLMAAVTAQGPRAVLARSRAVFRLG